MKTKIIPFDLETAKKIQAGEIEGVIKTRDGRLVRLLCANLKNEKSIVAAVTHIDGSENVENYGVSGNFLKSRAFSYFDLVLEVPDNETQFKPFDKVLVRDEDSARWKPVFYGYYDKENDPYFHICSDGCGWKQSIPYEGNEHLVGTTDKPKED